MIPCLNKTPEIRAWLIQNVPYLIRKLEFSVLSKTSYLKRKSQNINIGSKIAY